MCIAGLDPGLGPRIRIILVDAAKIENSQGNLQSNQCIGAVMPSPNDPEGVAQ